MNYLLEVDRVREVTIKAANIKQQIKKVDMQNMAMSYHNIMNAHNNPMQDVLEWLLY